MEDKKEFCNVIFEFIPKENDKNKSYFLTGNEESLGNWIKSNAIKLSFNEEKNLFRTETPIKIPAYKLLNYAYLIEKKEGQKIFLEQIPKNQDRSYIFNEVENIVLTDKEDKLGAKKRKMLQEEYSEKDLKKNIEKEWIRQKKKENSISITNEKYKENLIKYGIAVSEEISQNMNRKKSECFMLSKRFTFGQNKEINSENSDNKKEEIKKDDNLKDNKKNEIILKRVSRKPGRKSSEQNDYEAAIIMDKFSEIYNKKNDSNDGIIYNLEINNRKLSYRRSKVSPMHNQIHGIERTKSCEYEEDVVENYNDNDKDKYKNLDYVSDKECKESADDNSSTPINPSLGNYNETTDDILMFSFYLPLNYKKKENGEFDFVITNSPIFHNMYYVFQKKKNIKWYGQLKNEKYLNKEEKTKLAELLKQKNLYLIDIDKEIYTQLEVLYSEIIEPIFHYFSLKPKMTEDYNKYESYWKTFKIYNEKVANIIWENLKENTLIYLHDYHYSLVPISLQLLQSKFFAYKKKKLSIGLFFHVPFPSYEMFKRIPMKKPIVKSLLQCKVLGFHTFSTMNNFLDSAKNLLKINYMTTKTGELAANYKDNVCIQRVFNVTPEISLIEKYSKTDEFKRLYDEIITKSKNRIIFVSIDHLKFLICIQNKLEGYRRFLRNSKDACKNTSFYVYIRYSLNDYDENGNIILDESEKNFLENIERLVNEIKQEFGDEVINYYKGTLTYINRLALFAAARCYVRTSKLECFSLGVYEFMILKTCLSLDKKEITTMISENSGVNCCLSNNVKINPLSIESISNGFKDSYYLLNNSKLTFLENDRKQAMKSSFTDWFEYFLSDIKTSESSERNAYYMGADDAFHFRLMKLNDNFSNIEDSEITSIYEKRSRRLFFFDFVGTLIDKNQLVKVNEEYYIRQNYQRDYLISTLAALAEDKRNKVYIVVEQSWKEIQSIFGNIPGLGIATEYGFLYKVNPKSQKSKKTKMEKIIKNYDKSWIVECRNIMEPFKEHCEGSYFDSKEASIVWNYSECEQKLAKLYVSALCAELEHTIKKRNLRAVNGDGFLEVIFSDINKGYFISHIIKGLFNKNWKPDFIMCVGDESTDEKMFSYMNQKEKTIKKLSKGAKIYTITVGKKPSKANYYLSSPKELLKLINDCFKSSRKIVESLSVSNLLTRINPNNTQNDSDKEEEKEFIQNNYKNVNPFNLIYKGKDRKDSKSFEDIKAYNSNENAIKFHDANNEENEDDDDIEEEF